MNRLKKGERDLIYIHGSKCIDTITTSSRVLEFVGGCRMINYCEIINIDHRGYMVDLDFKRYFKHNKLFVKLRLPLHQTYLYTNQFNQKKPKVDLMVKKYQRLDDQMRLELVKLINEQGLTIRDASRKLNIPYPNAKAVN